MAPELIYNESFYFNEQKSVFEQFWKVETDQNQKIFAYLFRAALYKLILYNIRTCCSILDLKIAFRS